MLKNNKIPNHFTETVFSCERRDLLFSHSNGDIFTCENNMLISRVKMSTCFRAKAHLVFHWCLYNKEVNSLLLMIKVKIRARPLHRSEKKMNLKFGMHQGKFTLMVQVYFPLPGKGKDYEKEFLQVKCIILISCSIAAEPTYQILLIISFLLSFES